MIVTDPAVALPVRTRFLYPSFRTWQRECHGNGILPVVGISGARGKSTVLRLLESMLLASHLRTATWTDGGVEIRRRRQRGELSGWMTALTRLVDLSIDVALQELDWATVNAVGLPPGSYPAMAISGITSPADAGRGPNATEAALRAARRVVHAVHPNGFIVVSAADYQALELVANVDATVVLASLSSESPPLRRHLEDGGMAAWVRNGTIVFGDSEGQIRLCSVTEVPLTLNGEAAFNVSNVLIAVALALCMGLDRPSILNALRSFRPTWEILPRSLNLYEGPRYRAVVERLGPAAALRPVLKAANPGHQRRQVTVVGDLRALPSGEVIQVGRLLGRYHGAIVLHSDQDSERVQQFRSGLAENAYPPLFIYLPTERRAINRALKTLRADDVLVVLTSGDAASATRAIKRHIA